MSITHFLSLLGCNLRQARKTHNLANGLTGTNIPSAVPVVFFVPKIIDGQQQTIDDLHAINKAVVCYISIGTVESWRADSLEFPSGAVGGDVAGWAGENWLDVKDPVRMLAIFCIHPFFS